MFFYTDFKSQASSKDYFLIKKKNIYIKKLPGNRFRFLHWPHFYLNLMVVRLSIYEISAINL